MSRGYSVSVGSTFLVDPDDLDRLGVAPNEHLWVVVSLRTDDKGGTAAIIVSVTTIRKAHDKTCELDAGDHTFVRRPSYVLYREMRQVPLTTLEGLEADCHHAAMPEGTLGRIIAGIDASPFTPRKFKRKPPF